MDACIPKFSKQNISINESKQKTCCVKGSTSLLNRSCLLRKHTVFSGTTQQWFNVVVHKLSKSTEHLTTRTSQASTFKLSAYKLQTNWNKISNFKCFNSCTIFTKCSSKRQPQSCEMLMFPHFLDKQLTDGSEAVSIMCWLPSTPRNPRRIPLIPVRNWANSRSTV
jgi:hypothetical protein